MPSSTQDTRTTGGEHPPGDGDGGDGALSEPLAELFRERFDPMIRLATLLCGSQDVAHEVVMDAFARLVTKLDSVSEPAAYLRTSVVNGVHSHHRRLRTVRKHPIPPPTDVWQPEVDELWHRLESLRPDERACVVLRYYEDLPIADISTQLGMPPGTVKSHLHRGINKLRDLLNEEES